jgi:AAA15 family ATPase/GTPase
LRKRGFPAIVGVMIGDTPAVIGSMLLEFWCENVRSFRGEMRMSFEATSLSEPDVPRDVPWREDGRHPLRILPAAGIFGANASGKTNALRAMSDMRDFVMGSFRSSSPDSGIARRPFLLDPSVAQEPSTFGIELVLNGVLHEYRFSITDSAVVQESAYRHPRGKAALIFSRQGNEVELGASNRTRARAASEILRSNALYLSTAAAANHPDLVPLYRWFEQNLKLAWTASRPDRWRFTASLLRDGARRAQVLGLLQAADLGITDARVRQLDPQVMDRVRRAVRIITGAGDDADESADLLAVTSIDTGVALSHLGRDGNVEFQSEDESLGTLVWLGLAGPVVDSLVGGYALLVDEIEASLHPALVRQLVQLFQDPVSNPNGAQLIFNSHEASLLGDSVGDRVLGRDQVWFTEKLGDGSSRLYPLSDLSPRREESVSRRYVAGRYGATPILSPEQFTELAADIASSSQA